ncbi:MAG: acyl-[acyl-carrier-protein]--UDP-N-acetylglucosamine O-acyltransferase [Myxococcales bacterium]|nr:acyl-[acyl-carrier-protein]--UDP-N-acetylglucosamine O-acyltransferase [Myxococcales bacterium]
MTISPLAHVAEGAQVDPSAIIEPFTTIGPHAVVGPDCHLGPHAHVAGRTTLGRKVRIMPFASVGEVPPDLKFSGEPARLVIGDNTTIHEGATLTIGTAHGRMETTVGKNCLIMSYCHVGHDSIVGDGVIMANGAQLGGHVTVQDGAILGALSGVHQFCVIGRRAFLAGGAKVTQDIPPWCIAQGDRARLVGLNVERMRREQLDKGARKAIMAVYRACIRQRLEPEAAKQELGDLADHEEVAGFLAFLEASERGIPLERQSG